MYRKKKLDDLTASINKSKAEIATKLEAQNALVEKAQKDLIDVTYQRDSLNTELGAISLQSVQTADQIAKSNTVDAAKLQTAVDADLAAVKAAAEKAKVVFKSGAAAVDKLVTDAQGATALTPAEVTAQVTQFK